MDKAKSIKLESPAEMTLSKRVEIREQRVEI
jgi:hypothetical protein